jgi:hypothetical protein
MPFNLPTPQSFTPVSVRANAPTVSGVYGIGNAHEWIYIGETDNIRGTLLSHLQELNTLLMRKKPTGFVFEVCDPARRPARQDRLVLEYDPVCNRHLSRYQRLSENRTASPQKEISVKSVRMQFTLIGFSQDMGFRVFAFEGIAEDRTRAEYSVRTDLALVRRYGIRVQELPLLCRGLLERRDEGEQERTLTFTEEEMRLHANKCAEARNAAIRKGKPSRRPTTDQIGSACRSPQRW